MVDALLKEGARVNESAPKGGTPLHYAVQLGRTDLVSILLQNGANLDAKVCFLNFILLYFALFCWQSLYFFQDVHGKTPIDLCKTLNYPLVLQKMLEFQALSHFFDEIGEPQVKNAFLKASLFKYKLKYDFFFHILHSISFFLLLGILMKLSLLKWKLSLLV